AATASAPAWVAGARRGSAEVETADRAASSVNPKRVSPNVAAERRARRRTKSSAAPRVAPTITTSVEAGNCRRNAAAASSLTAADVEAMARSIALPDLAAFVSRARQGALHLAARRATDGAAGRNHN